MKGKAHFACGILTAAGISTICLINGEMNLLECAAMSVACAANSLIPDIDLPDSLAGRKIKPVSRIINKMYGHRTLTHSGLWLVVWAVLIYRFLKDPVVFPFILGGAFGYLSHFLSDMMTKGGVPLTWPFSRKRTHITRVVSGKVDELFVIITAIFISVFSSFFFKFMPV